MFEEFLKKYIKDKFNINIDFIEPNLEEMLVLLDIIYLYDDMENISTDEVKIAIRQTLLTVQSKNEIQIECIDGLMQLLGKNLIYNKNDINQYLIEGLSPMQQICILPLLMPDKFKGFAVPEIAKKFEKNLMATKIEGVRYLHIEAKLKHSDEYKEFVKSKLLNIQGVIFEKQKELNIKDCNSIKNRIKECQSLLNKLYAELHNKELALLSYGTKEGEIKEYMEDLVEVVQTSDNIEIKDIENSHLCFSVTGYYSIWKKEYLQKTLENISALPFVRAIDNATSNGIGEKLYRLIFEKRRLKIKVYQEFNIIYDTDNISGDNTPNLNKGLMNIHIGYYSCWDESKQIIQKYLHEYRYADAIMQTANSAYTLNLCDAPVTERLAYELLNEKVAKLIVDSKTNEELTLEEVIKRIKEGEYDEDII